MTTKATAAASLLTAARASGTFFGDRKCFLATIPGIDLGNAECRADLDLMRRTGLLEFARADLVAAMDPTLVAASEWRLDGAVFNFLVVP